MSETPRVWVGCLGCYNAGALVGKWVDAIEAEEVTVDTLADVIRAEFEGSEILAEHDGTWHPQASPHEELWCMDHEGFGPMLFGECSPAEAQRIAEALAEVEDGQREAFAAWFGNEHRDTSDLPALVEQFADSFRGEWRDLAEYAEEFCEDVYAEALEAMPSFLRYRIDWEGVGRDLRLGGDVWTVDAPGGQVWVFGM